MITKKEIIDFIGGGLPYRFTIGWRNEGDRQFEEENEPWAKKFKEILSSKKRLFTVRNSTNDCQGGKDISFYVSSGGSVYAHVAIFSLETLNNFVKKLFVFYRKHNEIINLSLGDQSIIVTLKKE